MTSIGSNELVSPHSSSFRPIYYLGCKNSFVSAIKSAIDEVDPSGGRLVDLFAGTGSVGSALASSREVTTVDIQEYSRVLCSATLAPATFSPLGIENIVTRILHDEVVKQMFWCFQPLINHERECMESAIHGTHEALVDLLESYPLAARITQRSASHSTRFEEARSETVRRLQESELWQSPETTVSRYFGGLYFSFEQAVMLDAALSIANSSAERNQDTLKAAILSVANQVVNTVGKQFAQPIQPKNKLGEVKPGLLKAVQRDRTLNVLELYRVWLQKFSSLPQAIGKPQFLRQDYVDALAQHGTSFSVIYADPPYTRDHYSRFYHVLETMCFRDNPAISQVTKDGLVMPSRGAYRENRHQSDFCIRSTAPDAFESLFKMARELDLPLVLSYSPHETDDGTHPRVVSMSKIIELANQHYSRVDVCSIDGVTHNQLNRSGLKLKKREQAEVILKCYR